MVAAGLTSARGVVFCRPSQGGAHRGGVTRLHHRNWLSSGSGLEITFFVNKVCRLLDVAWSKVWWKSVPACPLLFSSLTGCSARNQVFIKVWNFCKDRMQYCKFFIWCFKTLGSQMKPKKIVLTFQFRATISAALVPRVVGAVVYFWDADQELAVISEDHHGQLSPALLHQVFGLQQR